MDPLRESPQLPPYGMPQQSRQTSERHPLSIVSHVSGFFASFMMPDNKEPNQKADPLTAERVSQTSNQTVFKKRPPDDAMEEIQNAIVNVLPISDNFTSEKSIEEQRASHREAKDYLSKHLSTIGATVSFISPPKRTAPPQVASVEILPLPTAVFSWKNTEGVARDIQLDGARTSDDIVIYSAASQFNGCEACGPYTLPPGEAVRHYKSDPTQGPQAQLQFHPNQVELINCGGNIGFNGLCHILDEQTKSCVQHGYFMPQEEMADAVIDALSTKDEIEYLCVENRPYQKGQNRRDIKSVHMLLISAPAFGYGGMRPGPERNEIEFLCALKGFRAQFQHCIDLAQKENKSVVFNAAGMGLGVFGNDVLNVAKAFNVAGKEFESQLEANRVQVRFQVYKRGGKTQQLANLLDLQEWTNQAS
ncbi:MAG: hypothetical protein ACH350_07525 [Parachlamydiaceae bacterium]